MAFKQHIRVSYLDYIRKIIGDPDKILFSDDELKSYFDQYSSTNKCTGPATCNNDLRYRVGGCCPGGVPGWKLVITVGITDAVYIIDEPAMTIWFDSADPDNGAADPAEGDQITVTYYTMGTNALLSELFFVLSSNHAKLVSAQKIMGVEMDLRELSDAFYAQSVRYAAEGCD